MEKNLSALHPLGDALTEIISVFKYSLRTDNAAKRTFCNAYIVVLLLEGSRKKLV